ncbi:MAG: M15 family metallopeptidase [Syntrophorhabdus sp.]|nr:M15 family metallopeptidase [Syntrophorhabdus sp.]
MYKRVTVRQSFFILAGLALLLVLPLAAVAGDDARDRFVDVREHIPSVIMDIRYFSPHNFVGERIDGYNAPKCLLTREAAGALKRVQEDLEGFSLSLKIYDCYRPQRAVSHFVRWAKDIGDTRTRKEFYPTVDKSRLFEDGYIAERSGHSRGSTVDLTIVPMPVPEQQEYDPGQELFACYLPASERFRDNSIDMGTGFDCFHTLANTANRSVGPVQRANRLLLKTLMERQGFVNYDKEWWHFTLKNEPFPDTYFDFPID